MASRGVAEQGWVTGVSASSRTQLSLETWEEFGKAHLSGCGQVQDSSLCGQLGKAYDSC